MIVVADRKEEKGSRNNPIMVNEEEREKGSKNIPIMVEDGRSGM